MRIMHWYPNFQGGGAVANALLGLAREQSMLGADVAVVSVEASGPPLYSPMQLGEKLEHFVWKPAWSLRMPPTLLRGISANARKTLRQWGPDVVHIHGEFLPDNLWVPRLFDCAIVLSPQGAFHPARIGRRRKLFKALYIAFARQLLYRRISAFHALCPAEATHIASIHSDAVIYNVPNGPNPEIAFESINKDKRARNIRRSITFFFVGRLDVFHKGLDILLEAYARASCKLTGQRCSLILVGPDWEGGRDWIERTANTLGISHQLQFTGPLNSKQLIEIFEKADIYVHLARYEGLSLACVEALLAGKPAILSSEVGAISYPEVSSLPHIREVSATAAIAAATMVEFVRNLDELTLSAARHREELRQFFSWRRIAALHSNKYETLIRQRADL